MATISVRDFGATGDGSTDDIPAILEANATLASGDVLYFPPGDYRVGSASIYPPADGVIYRGAGIGSVLRMLPLPDGSIHSIIRLSSPPQEWNGEVSPDIVTDGVTIEGLVFDGNLNPEPVSGGDYFGVLCQQASNLTVRKCLFRDWHSDAFSASNGNVPIAGLVVEDCRFVRNRRNAIHVGNAVNYRITRCRTTDSPSQYWSDLDPEDADTGSAGNGIDIEVEGYDYYGPSPHNPYARDGVIEDCLVANAECVTGDRGIALQGGYGNIDGLVIRRNVVAGFAVAIYGEWNGGVRYDGLASVNDVTVEDNWINSARYLAHDPTGNPLNFKGTENFAITGNVVNDLTGSVFSTKGAFLLEWSKFGTVTGNTARMSKFLNPGETSLAWVRDGSDTIAITGNSYQSPGDVAVVVEDDPPLNECLGITESDNTPLDHDDWDREFPVCTLSATEGQVVTDPITVTVTATDIPESGVAASGIARVFFHVDGIPHGHSDTAPHTFPFDPADFSEGEHVLSALAVDNQANLGDEVFVAVQVSHGTTTETSGLLLESGDALLREQGDALLAEAEADEEPGPTARILMYTLPGGNVLMFSQQA